MKRAGVVVSALLACALFAREGGAVVRVGNKVVDRDGSRAMFEVPPQLIFEQASPEGWLRLMSLGIRKHYVNVLDFRVAYPEFSELSRSGLKEALKADDAGEWDVVSMETCVLSAHRAASDEGESDVWFATWGAGRGFTFVAQPGAATSEAVASMLSSLVVPKGECAWPQSLPPP